MLSQNTVSKTYWTIIINLSYNKKIPAKPQLLVDGNFVFQILIRKVTYLTIFFASICTFIKNGSTLPSFPNRTNSRVNSFHATEKVILILQFISLNKKDL